MKVYANLMRRWGSDDTHCYIADFSTDKRLLDLLGVDHYSFRGGKYYHEIIECDFPNKFDPEKFFCIEINNEQRKMHQTIDEEWKKHEYFLAFNGHQRSHLSIEQLVDARIHECWLATIENSKELIIEYFEDPHCFNSLKEDTKVFVKEAYHAVKEKV